MSQIDIFSELLPAYKFPSNRPVRLFESFSGVGCQRMGFEKADIDYEVVGISEIDKYALKSYEAMHGECPNLGSITDIKGIDMPKDIDVFTYSFPCTDLSKAGKQKGLNDTRSGLVYEVLRILHELQSIQNLPRVLIMENVVDLVQKKFIKQCNEIQLELESLGYKNYTQTLNAKNYGVAQNRDRVFMVSILGEYSYTFPNPIELTRRLKDALEKEVDEKYYLSQKQLRAIQNPKFESMTNRDVSNTIRTSGRASLDKHMWDVVVTKIIGNTNPSGHGMNGNVWSGDLSPTLTTNKGEGIKIVEPIICAQRGRNPDNPKSRKTGDPTVQMFEVGPDGLSNTLTTVQKDNMVAEPAIAVLGSLDPSDKIQDKKRVVSVQGLYPSILASSYKSMVKIGETLHIPEAYGNKKYVLDRLNEFYEKHGYYPELFNPYNRQEITDVSPALTAQCGRWQTSSTVVILSQLFPNRGIITLKNVAYWIRKLTPLECFRLMGIDDDKFYRAAEVVSNSQLYKQAGNGIVVNVFAEIVRTMK